MTAAVPLALLGLTACSDIDNPVGPQPPVIPPAPPAVALSDAWSVTIVSTSGETHHGDLELEQLDRSMRGEIHWGWGVEGLLGDPWELAGTVNGNELTFRINEDACWWEGLSGNDGVVSATVTDDGQRMVGGIHLTPLCGQEPPQDWDFSATKR